jgi:hypothetical protein
MSCAPSHTTTPPNDDFAPSYVCTKCYWTGTDLGEHTDSACRYETIDVNENARRAIATLQQKLAAAEAERDALDTLCPEDVGPAEYIAALQRRARNAEAEKVELIAFVERVKQLSTRGDLWTEADRLLAKEKR